MIRNQDVVYLGDYKLLSFDGERNVVFFNARRIDGADFSEDDETNLFQLLQSIGKWEQFMLYNRCKQMDIRGEESEQLVTSHQFYTYTWHHIPEVLMRVGRRYGILIEPPLEPFEEKYQIALENLVDFLRESIINLQKWIYYQEMI